MKPAIHVIATLNRVGDKEGEEQFAGSLDLAALRKTKRSEIEVVLVPVDSFPKVLGKLVKRNSVSDGGLILFAGAGSDEECGRRKG
jgi:hypothetical protein